MLSAPDAARSPVSKASMRSRIRVMFHSGSCAPAAVSGHELRAGAAQASSLDSLQHSFRAATFMMSAISISFCSAAASHRYRLQSCRNNIGGNIGVHAEGSGLGQPGSDILESGGTLLIRQQVKPHSTLNADSLYGCWIYEAGKRARSPSGPRRAR